MSENSGEIFTAVTKPEALAQAEIHDMRQMGDAIQLMGRSLEAMSTKVDDVRERVIRLEEQKATKLVERVEHDLREQLSTAKSEHASAMTAAVSTLERALGRIDALERSRDEATGARSVLDWISKNAAWLFAVIAAGVAGLALKSGLLR